MRYKLFICAALLLTILTSYSQHTRIIGNITDESYASIILSPAIYSKLIDSKTEVSSKRGSFEFVIHIDKPCFYRLYYKERRISIYVEPNAAIQLSLDNFKDSEFVNFYGDLSAENTFLNQGEIPLIGSASQREQFKKLAMSGESAYIDAVKSEMATQSALFKTTATQAGLSSKFSSLYEKNNIEMAGLLYQYYYARFAHHNSDSFIATNPNFLAIFSALPPEDGYESSLLYYENHMNALKSKVNQKFRDNFIYNKTDDLQLYKAYLVEANALSPSQVKDYILENLIGEWVSYYGRTLDIKDEIVQYIGSLTNKDKKEAVKKKLVNLAQYEAGKPAPVFSFEDNAGNIRTLKEFVGKLVYIDAWASWCAPCIEEIPYAKKLYEKYKKNPDIEFLYISIDDKKENWEKALRTHQLNDGVQGIAFPGGFNSDFAQKYSIQGIPNYIIIDKSGNLVNHKAPHPSQTEKLFQLLDNLLNVPK